MLNFAKMDAFELNNLNEAFNHIPYQPGFLGSFPLFKRGGTTQLWATLEHKHGVISLIPVTARGTNTQANPPVGREARPFPIPQISLADALKADDVQGIRQMGTEDAQQSVEEKMNEKMETALASIEATLEHMRAGAIQGKTMSADGSLIFDFFDEYGIVRTEVDFDMTNASGNLMKIGCQTVQRSMARNLGGGQTSRPAMIYGICGEQWFDNFVTNPEVKQAYELWVQNDSGSAGTTGGTFLRTAQLAGAGFDQLPFDQSGFYFAGIHFFDYSRNQVGTTSFVPTDECQFIPVGLPEQIFVETYGPANYMSSVGNIGQARYASAEMMKHGKGVELEWQANPFVGVARPAACIKGTLSNPVVAAMGQFLDASQFAAAQATVQVENQQVESQTIYHQTVDQQQVDGQQFGEGSQQNVQNQQVENQPQAGQAGFPGQQPGT